jgi:hypothetical protein
VNRPMGTERRGRAARRRAHHEPHPQAAPAGRSQSPR